MAERETTDKPSELIAELLCFHAGEDVEVDQLVSETGLDWGTVHNAVRLIETIQTIVPDVSFDGSTASVDEDLPVAPELYATEEMTVLSYLFAHTRTVETVILSNHPVLEANPDGVDDAIEDGYVTRGENTIGLTPEGVGYIAPKYSAALYVNDS